MLFFLNVIFQLRFQILVVIVISFKANQLYFSYHSYGFYSFFSEEFLEFTIGFSHLSNSKPIYCQQVFSCYCCYIALLLASDRALIKTREQVRNLPL